MEKWIQCYFSLNGSDGNPNIENYDKNGSLCTLARTQTSKLRNSNHL